MFAWIRGFAMVGWLTAFCVPAQPFENNIDRPGRDFTSVTLPPGSQPQACAELCDADETCRAWTFVRANVQAPNPRCWLKFGVPAAVANNCCVSDVKLAAVVEPNVDRPGGDFANVTLPSGSQPQACRSLCEADGNCRSWTFVRPGVQTDNPRCWLKNIVPAAFASNCCVSGVMNP
jgi:hypothetical protein